jgi:hypothetical protein
MSQGTEKGRWWCDGKPEEAVFHIHNQDDVLQRIAAATSPYARSGSTTGPYDPHQAQHAPMPPGATPMPVYQGRAPEYEQPQESRQADFEDIEDEWAYRLAQELYYDAEPDEIVEFGRDTFLLFENDQAVLRVTARRSVDLVDIEAFRSRRGVIDCWEEILHETS